LSVYRTDCLLRIITINIKTKIFILFLLFLGLTALLTTDTAAQGYLSQKYKLARSFEQSGDFVNAARLYLELYEADKKNENYFVGYIRTMKEQNQYSQLIPFAEKHTAKYPISAHYTLLGELYWRKGQAEKADEVWQKAVETEKYSQNTYANLAITQISLRLFQKAIDTYNLARKNLDTPDIFANRLSQLYSINGDYQNGTREVLILFAQMNNIALAEGRLSALNVNPDAEKYIYAILKEKAEDNSIQFKRLFAWYLTSLDRNKEALKLYKKIDTYMNSRGGEVYNFALNAANDGNYDIAIEGLQWIIAKGKNSHYTVSALFKLVKTTEMKFEQADELNKNTAQNLIKEYRSVIEDYPDTPTAQECIYNIALLYKRIGKLNKALAELNKLTSLQQYSKYRVSAILLQGEIYFMQNKTDLAVLSYKKIVELFKRFDKIYDRALYSLAEIEYFNGNFDSATVHFTDLTLHSESDVANDALEKISLIEANRNLNKALTLFAKAEKAEKQGKNKEATGLFLEAAKSAKQKNLYESAIIKTADIEFRDGNKENAKAYYEEIIKNKPDGIRNDYCLFRIGVIYFVEKKYDRAIMEFTKILKDYPQSIYNEKARNYIRQIRNHTNREN
jgi:tetratricopeptide (TPR) repeat protein